MKPPIPYPMQLVSPAGSFFFADKNMYAHHITLCRHTEADRVFGDCCQRCATKPVTAIPDTYRMQS